MPAVGGRGGRALRAHLSRGRLVALLLVVATVASLTYRGDAGASGGAAGGGGTACRADHVTQLPLRQARAKAQVLLAKMTLTQEDDLLHGAGTYQGPVGSIGSTEPIPSLGIPALTQEDGPAGIGDQAQGVNPTAGARGARRHLRSLRRRLLRPGDRGRGPDQGGRDGLRTHGQHRPGAPMGEGIREPRRGPRTRRHHRRRRGGGHPAGRGHGPGEALRRLRPGDQPPRPGRRRRAEHKGPPRDLPPPVHPDRDHRQACVDYVRLRRGRGSRELRGPLPDRSLPRLHTALHRVRGIRLPRHRVDRRCARRRTRPGATREHAVRFGAGRRGRGRPGPASRGRSGRAAGAHADGALRAGRESSRRNGAHARLDPGRPLGGRAGVRGGHHAAEGRTQHPPPRPRRSWSDRRHRTGGEHDSGDRGRQAARRCWPPTR